MTSVTPDAAAQIVKTVGPEEHKKAVTAGALPYAVTGTPERETEAGGPPPSISVPLRI